MLSPQVVILENRNGKPSCAKFSELQEEYGNVERIEGCVSNIEDLQRVQGDRARAIVVISNGSIHNGCLPQKNGLSMLLFVKLLIGAQPGYFLQDLVSENSTTYHWSIRDQL